MAECLVDGKLHATAASSLRKRGLAHRRLRVSPARKFDEMGGQRDREANRSAKVPLFPSPGDTLGQRHADYYDDY